MFLFPYVSRLLIIESSQWTEGRAPRFCAGTINITTPPLSPPLKASYRRSGRLVAESSIKPVKTAWKNNWCLCWKPHQKETPWNISNPSTTTRSFPTVHSTSHCCWRETHRSKTVPASQEGPLCLSQTFLPS